MNMPGTDEFLLVGTIRKCIRTPSSVNQLKFPLPLGAKKKKKKKLTNTIQCSELSVSDDEPSYSWSVHKDAVVLHRWANYFAMTTSSTVICSHFTAFLPFPKNVLLP